MSSTRKRLEALTAGLTVPEEAVAAPTSLPAVPSTPEALPVSAAVPPQTQRFPEAQVGRQVARTGPGQMLAFRGQMQAVEGEIGGLRERLKLYEDSMPTRRLDPKSIQPSRFANRHHASFNTQEFASLKADISHAGINIQPILVRPLDKQPGKYELVFGHRRHRACLELGIAVATSIWTEPLSDAELFAAMDRENRERANLSPYEQGIMYARALDEQLYPTQRQLAENLGVSHTWVRKALQVAQLPIAIIECFSSPLDVQYRHAELLNVGLEKDRKGLLKRAEKLRGLKLAPMALVARLLGNEPMERIAKKSLTVEGKTVGSYQRAANGSVTILLLPAALSDSSSDSLAKALSDLVQSLGRTVRSP